MEETTRYLFQRIHGLIASRALLLGSREKGGELVWSLALPIENDNDQTKYDNSKMSKKKCICEINLPAQFACPSFVLRRKARRRKI